jgi:hypothetical protein
MKRDFKHLSYEERVVIECLNKQNKSLREIAKILKRSPNTISYELKKNKVNNDYLAIKAKHKSYYKRYLCKKGCMKVSMNKEIRDFVDDNLKLKWSPERISGYLKRKNISCSSKAIYKYIYARCLERYLMHKGKKKNKSYYRHIKYLKGERKYIEERVLTKEMGHYELDFIVSSKSPSVLLVCVDKHTRFTKILLLPNRKHSTIVSAFYELFSNRLIKSITTDNDIAFSKWKQLEKLFKTKIYFTHPYHSWEKGLVENTNRWIRVFVPKKTEISTVTKDQIDSALYYLNDIPRQCLDYRTAHELYYINQINSLTSVS